MKALWLLLLAAGLARAQEPGPAPAWQWGAETRLVSSYVWRGFTSNRGPSLQPALWVSRGGLELSSWSLLSWDADNDHVYREHNLEARYEHEWRDQWTAVCGYVAYSPVHTTTTHEAYAGMRFEGPLTLALTAYQEMNAGAGTYVEAEMERMFDLRRAELKLNSGIALNRRYDIEATVFSHARFEAAVTFDLGKGVSLAPEAGYSMALDREWFDDNVYVGLTLGYER